MHNISSPRAHRRHVRRQFALAGHLSSLADQPRHLHVDAPAGDEVADSQHEAESDRLQDQADRIRAALAPADLAWVRRQPPQSPAMEAARAWVARRTGELR